MGGDGAVSPLGRSYLLLLIGSKYGNLLVGDIRPLHELLPPLHNRDTATNSFTCQSSVNNGALSTHEEVQRTRHDFLIVQAAVIPTSVLPAPQGNTIIPDRARLGHL